MAELREGGRPVLCVVTQNSGGQRTGWHEERWVVALRHAHERLGYGLAFLGTGADGEKIEALREAVGAGVSLAGRTTIGQLAAVLALGDLVVSLDTGTMHLGRAVGVPMVVLGPSWQRPVEWLPLGKAHIRIVRGGGPGGGSRGLSSGRDYGGRCDCGVRRTDGAVPGKRWRSRGTAGRGGFGGRSSCRTRANVRTVAILPR